MAVPRSQRGEVVTHPYELAIGDVLAIVDRDRVLSGLPSVMARIAILRFHDTTELRSRRAGIAKAGAGDPNHFHGILSYVTPEDEADGVPTEGFQVLINAGSDTIQVSQRSGSEVPDLPHNPLFMLDGKV